MPEHIANAHRTTTRTQRPASRSLSRCNRGRYFHPNMTTMRHHEKTVLPKRTHSQVLLQPVCRPAPDAFVKLGRVGNRDRAGGASRMPPLLGRPGTQNRSF